MIKDKTIYYMEKQTSNIGIAKVRVKGRQHKEDYEKLGYACVKQKQVLPKKKKEGK